MLTYSRMPPYLRFTPSSPRILRDTTTDPARRAGLARVRKQREPDARAAVAQRDARPVHVGREGERLEAHGRAVGHGARAAAPGSGSTCTSMSPAIRRLAVSHRQRGTIRDRAALHLLGQLEQNPSRRLGMQERDAAAIGAAAGLLVDQTVAGRPAALERP